MSRKAEIIANDLEGFATLPSGERLAYSPNYLRRRDECPKVDGRIAANKRRHPVIKRVPVEKGAAIRALLPPDIAERSATAETFVYFARDGFEIKIGVTKDVRKRVASFQTYRSGQIQIEYVIRGGRELESYLHEKFKSSRLHGEWFRYSGEIEAFLNGLPHDESEGALIL